MVMTRALNKAKLTPQDIARRVTKHQIATCVRLPRLDQRKVAARHHTEGSILPIPGAHPLPRRAPVLPKVAPDGIQQDAETPRGTATGEKQASALNE